MTEPGGTVAVAPREIIDAVFRACRVVGCEASLADRVAADVCHGEIHHADGLSAFVELLDAGAPVLIEHARASIVPDDSAPLLFRRRHTDGGRPEVERAAFAEGVSVDGALWSRVDAVAANFLLSEAVLDAAEQG